MVTGVGGDLGEVLVIGVGNDLRGDDAAGRRVAWAVEALGLPGVTVHAVHQLVPELATDLRGCRRVIFVDAAVDAASVTVRRVSAAPADSSLTHHGSPGSLLGLAGALGGAPGDAFVVAVPVRALGVGEELSEVTAAAVPAAVDAVVRLCRGAADVA